MSKNLLDVIGINKSLYEYLPINKKEAYRKMETKLLQTLHHPDTMGDDKGLKKIQEINEAVELLKDPDIFQNMEKKFQRGEEKSIVTSIDKEGENETFEEKTAKIKNRFNVFFEMISDQKIREEKEIFLIQEYLSNNIFESAEEMQEIAESIEDSELLSLINTLRDEFQLQGKKEYISRVSANNLSGCIIEKNDEFFYIDENEKVFQIKNGKLKSDSDIHIVGSLDFSHVSTPPGTTLKPEDASNDFLVSIDPVVQPGKRLIIKKTSSNKCFLEVLSSISAFKIYEKESLPENIQRTIQFLKKEESVLEKIIDRVSMYNGIEISEITNIIKSIVKDYDDYARKVLINRDNAIKSFENEYKTSMITTNGQGMNDYFLEEAKVRNLNKYIKKSENKIINEIKTDPLTGMKSFEYILKEILKQGMVSNKEKDLDIEIGSLINKKSKKSKKNILRQNIINYLLYKADFPERDLHEENIQFFMGIKQKIEERRENCDSFAQDCYNELMEKIINSLGPYSMLQEKIEKTIIAFSKIKKMSESNLGQIKRDIFRENEKNKIHLSISEIDKTKNEA